MFLLLIKNGNLAISAFKILAILFAFASEGYLLPCAYIVKIAGLNPEAISNFLFSLFLIRFLKYVVFFMIHLYTIFNMPVKLKTKKINIHVKKC